MGIGRTGISFCLLLISAKMASAQEPLSAVVKSVNDFTLDLYLNTADVKGPGKNILVSPLSAALVTAMVHAGAQGKTADEIATVLKFPKDKSVLESGFTQLHELLANTPNVTLEVANTIYLDKSKKLKPNYAKTVTDVHKSEVQMTDFINDAEKSRGEINNWVSAKTHEKIKDLLAPGSLTSDARLVLVNAVYFYGRWKEQFDRQQTYEEDFYITKDKTVKVPMMHLTKTLRYADIPELDAKAVELCYTNQQVCLQIILPNAKDGLAAMQDKLRSKAFDLSNIDFYPTKVQLSMPKFKLEETIDIKEVYQKMGIKSMFSDTADLSGMIEGNEPLTVSKAVQKTFMDVNEEGTEAAAATGTLVVESVSFVIPVPFVANHPFLARLSTARTTLFVGRVSSPTASSHHDES